MSTEKTPSYFDEGYFSRFYENPEISSYLSRTTKQYARFILSSLDLLDFKINSINDVGCGVGLWQKAFAEEDKSIRYNNYDASDYLCDLYGWTKCKIDEAPPAESADVVICNSVLSYLDNNNAEKALNHLAANSTLALFLGVATDWDYNNIISKRHSDIDVFRRPSSFYKNIISNEMWHFGGGLFIRRSAPYCAHELWFRDQ